LHIRFSYGLLLFYTDSFDGRTETMTNRDRIAILAAGAAVAAVPALAIAAEAIFYKYDARGRLIEVVRNDGSGNVVTNYGFDKADNRTVKTTSGSANSGPP
jgi:hypothetical protein